MPYDINGRCANFHKWCRIGQKGLTILLSTLLPYVILLVMLKSFSSLLLGSNFILKTTVVGNQLQYGSVWSFLEKRIAPIHNMQQKLTMPKGNIGCTLLMFHITVQCIHTGIDHMLGFSKDNNANNPVLHDIPSTYHISSKWNTKGYANNPVLNDNYEES